MNIWEQLALALVTSAAQDAPLFVHSSQGSLILNASENLLGNLISVFNKPAAATTTATTATVTTTTTSPGPVTVPSVAEEPAQAQAS